MLALWQHCSSLEYLSVRVVSQPVLIKLSLRQHKCTLNGWLGRNRLLKGNHSALISVSHFFIFF